MVLPCLLGYLFLVALSAAFSLVFLCVCVFYYFCVHLLSSAGVVVAVLHLLFIFVQSNCAFLALGWSLLPNPFQFFKLSFKSYNKILGGLMNNNL